MYATAPVRSVMQLKNLNRASQKATLLESCRVGPNQNPRKRKHPRHWSLCHHAPTNAQLFDSSCGVNFGRNLGKAGCQARGAVSVLDDDASVGRAVGLSGHPGTGAERTLRSPSKSTLTEPFAPTCQRLRQICRLRLGGTGTGIVVKTTTKEKEDEHCSA